MINDYGFVLIKMLMKIPDLTPLVKITTCEILFFLLVLGQTTKVLCWYVNHFSAVIITC